MPMSALFLLEAAAAVEEGWLMEGITALISGMGATFAILILISWIISLFKYLKKGEIKHEHKEARINAVVEEKASETIEEAIPSDDLELIAVITAAIAASMNTTTDQLQVKSLRRISGRI